MKRVHSFARKPTINSYSFIQEITIVIIKDIFILKFTSENFKKILNKSVVKN